MIVMLRKLIFVSQFVFAHPLSDGGMHAMSGLGAKAWFRQPICIRVLISLFSSRFAHALLSIPYAFTLILSIHHPLDSIILASICCVMIIMN